MVRTDRIEPDAVVVARLGETALALPEAYEEDAWTGVRWRIRTKTFAHVMVAQAGFESSFRDLTGIADPTTILTFRAAGDELLALIQQRPAVLQATVVTDHRRTGDRRGHRLGRGCRPGQGEHRFCAPRTLARLLDGAADRGSRGD